MASRSPGKSAPGVLERAPVQAAGEMPRRPGLVALLGSGETSPAGRKMHDFLFARLPKPATMAILETPAGFQPNVDRVAEKIADFVRRGLRNYDPRVLIVQARKRGTPFDPDSPQIAHFVLPADYIFLGPGSPTYTARQLRDSLTLRYILQRHREGAMLALASAAALAAGTWVLPVYEIYKSGEDLRWEPGLDLFRSYGLDLAVVTHWNNREGGKDLDTSRCYMGQERFRQLCELLPTETTILGVDEQVTCILDFGNDEGQIFGPGGITIIGGGQTRTHGAGERFSLDELR